MPKGWPIAIEPPLTFRLFLIDAQPVAAINHLHGEGLVQFPQVDILHGQSVARQQPRHGEDRTDAHLVRLAAGHDEAAEGNLGLDAQ